MNRAFFSRLLLIPIGILLGLLARQIFGPPETVRSELLLNPYQIERTSVVDPDEQIKQHGGLVEPLEIPVRRDYGNTVSTPLNSQNWLAGFDQHQHGQEATFHAHGEEVCASGCAASHHPTEELSAEHYHRLIKRFSSQPLNQDSSALEELLYFGPQTSQLISQHGTGNLDSKRQRFLIEQLRFGHAKVSIRVVDEHGETRCWLEPTRVPFDRRHVFHMQANNVQELVTSGTVKRVGLHHIWMRL